MRILVLGGDGYLGWPTAMYFSQLGHDVLIVDNLAKRQWEAEVDGAPLEPVPTLRHRVRVWNDVTGSEIAVSIGDIAENPRFVYCATPDGHVFALLEADHPRIVELIIDAVPEARPAT